MNPTLTLLRRPRRSSTGFRATGRIPSKLREETLRKLSGRGWIGADPERVAHALGIDVRNARKRIAGEAGPFAGFMVEHYQLAAAGEAPTAARQIAELKAVGMMPPLAALTTEELFDLLDTRQAQEQATNANLDNKQMRYLLRDEVCMETFLDRALEQSAITEEIAAIVMELRTRQDWRMG